MARAVEGFLSSDGKFWKTKEEANLHEAAYDLATATVSFAEYILGQSVDVASLENSLRAFIKGNEETITNYYKANTAYADSTSARIALSLARQSTPDNPEDGESVRDGADSNVGEDTTPKNNSSST